MAPNSFTGQDTLLLSSAMFAADGLAAVLKPEKVAKASGMKADDDGSRTSQVTAIRTAGVLAAGLAAHAALVAKDDDAAAVKTALQANALTFAGCTGMGIYHVCKDEFDKKKKMVIPGIVASAGMAALCAWKSRDGKDSGGGKSGGGGEE